MSDQVAEQRAVERRLQTVVDYFVAYRGRDIEPPRGTVVAKLWAEGKLSKRHCLAAERLFEDLQAAMDGPSPSTTDPTRPAVQSGNLRVVSVSPSAAARERVEKLIRWLHVHEYRLLDLVVADYHDAMRAGREPGHSRLDLAATGTQLSGYKGRAQAMAASTARIQALLTTIAEFYNIREDVA